MQSLPDSPGNRVPEPATAPAVATRTLPRPLTTFVGRDRELASIRGILDRDDVQLLTLTGAGGVGKTRLALRIANGASDTYDHGIWFVSLGSVHDPALVPGAIARATGVMQAASRSPAEDLVAALRDTPGLLILDNFEHVLPSADLVSSLIAANPGLKIIVTSRTVLHMASEHVFDVPPLLLPGNEESLPLDEIESADAVQLFARRARETGTGFELDPTNVRVVGEICRVLDGLPLAIELAVPWLRVLAPGALLERLDHRLSLLERGPRDAPERHRTLRSTIDWSYVLLSPDEQGLLRRLTVFVGGFPLDAIEPVTEVESQTTGDPTADMLSQLGTLVDNSLIRLMPETSGPAWSAVPRYIVLEMIREYGLERLAEHGELDTVRRRHASWCLELAESAARERMGQATSRFADRLVAEQHNLRTALVWLETSGDINGALHLAATLWPLWIEHGEVTEGRSHLARLLARPEASVDRDVWAHASSVLGLLAQAQGDMTLAQETSRQALAVFEATGNDRGAGTARTTLGLVEMLRGDHASATAHLEAALRHFRAADDPRAGSWALRHLSSVAYRHGDIDRYEALAREGLAIIIPMGNTLDIARLGSSLALAATVHGHVSDATAKFEAVLAQYREAEDRWGEADVLQRLGHLAYLRHDDELAERLYARSEALLHRIEDPEGMARVRCGQGWLARRQGKLSLAAERFSDALTIARAHDVRRSVAKALLGDGAIALDRGNIAATVAAWGQCLPLVVELDDQLALLDTLEWITHLAGARSLPHAARLAGVSAALREATGIPMLVMPKMKHELLIRALRHQLGDETFGAEVDAGRSLTVNEAVSLAYDILDLADTSASIATLPGAVGQGRAVSALTAREQEVIRLIAQGHSDQEVADALFISRRTAATHAAHIYNKIGVSSRAAAAAYAVRHGLL